MHKHIHYLVSGIVLLALLSGCMPTSNADFTSLLKSQLSPLNSPQPPRSLLRLLQRQIPSPR